MDESYETSDPINTSTPLEETVLANEGTFYKSIDNSSVYASALDETFNPETDEEIVVSEPEENEVQFIGTNELTGEELFVVVSEVNIKEKDAMNGKTSAKWGLTALESVERLRSNLIRLTFDTIRKDKRERKYRMETKCCQELERMLREFLSSRPLSEMNQTVFKCLKCNSQFSREINDRKGELRNDDVVPEFHEVSFLEIKCPCGSNYVIAIHKTTKCEASPPKTSFLAGSLFMPLTALTAMPAVAASSINIDKKSDDSSGSIPKTSHSFSSIGEKN
jgi:hypothetical protein